MWIWGGERRGVLPLLWPIFTQPVSDMFKCVGSGWRSTAEWLWKTCVACPALTYIVQWPLTNSVEVVVEVCFGRGRSTCVWRHQPSSPSLSHFSAPVNHVTRSHRRHKPQSVSWLLSPSYDVFRWTDELTGLVFIPDYSWSFYWLYWSFSCWHMSISLFLSLCPLSCC